MAENNGNGKGGIKLSWGVVITILLGVIGSVIGVTYNKAEKAESCATELRDTVRTEYVDKDQYQRDIGEIKDMLNYLVKESKKR